MLLYWFYIKKVWIKHSLPKLSKIKYSNLYMIMCSILKANIENFLILSIENLRLHMLKIKGYLNI